MIIQRTHSGCGQFYWNGCLFPVPTDQAFIAIVPEESSYFYSDDSRVPWTFSWINLYGSLAVATAECLRQDHGPVLSLARRTSAGAAFDALVRQAERRIPTDPHDTSISCFTFLMEWSRWLKRSGAQVEDPVQTAIRICQTRSHEPLGVKELAAETGLTREHFTRLFAARTGTSPARYLRDLRCIAARKMLKTTDLPRHETALRCGFPSVRALNRALADR